MEDDNYGELTVLLKFNGKPFAEIKAETGDDLDSIAHNMRHAVEDLGEYCSLISYKQLET